MKKIILAFLLISNFAFADGNTGGMDGGGGGVLPAYPVSAFEVQEIAESAKIKMLYMLNRMQGHRLNDEKSYWKKLFSDRRSAQEILRNLDLEVRLREPCYTSDGREVDGSIHAQKPNTICLSAGRISQKVDVLTAEREILGLLMHELSHYCSATEEEAVALQKDVIFYYQFAVSRGEGFFKDDQLREKYDLVSHSLYQSLEILEKEPGNQEQIFKQLSDLNKYFSDFINFSHNFSYAVFNPFEESYLDFLQQEIRMANFYAGMNLSDPQQKKYYQSLYEICMDGQEYCYDVGNPNYGDRKIKRLHSNQELLQFIKELIAEIKPRGAFIYQITFEGMRWVNLNGHYTSENPWRNFLGNYQMSNSSTENSSKCRNWTGLKVESSSDGEVYIRRLNPSGSDTIATLVGSYNLNLYVNQVGLVGQSGVSLNQEFGGSWSTRQSQIHEFTSENIKLNLLDDQRFELTVTSLFRSAIVSEPERVQVCKYSGNWTSMKTQTKKQNKLR